MKKNNSFFAMFVIVISLSLCACTTMVPVNPSPQSIHKNVRVGDKVSITSMGQTYNFTVTRLTKQKIYGSDVSIPIKNIETIGRKDLDKTKTAIAAGGGGAGALGIAALITFIAVGGILIL